MARGRFSSRTATITSVAGATSPRTGPPPPPRSLAHLRARGAYCDIGTACHVGDLERVRELLDQDPSLANRVSDYVTYYLGSGAPLRNAAANGHLEIVRLLLERGADPNLREEGIAPHGHALYSAVANRHLEIARLLLEHGAFPNPEVESSADALSRAISNSDQPMIDLLCSHGAARALHLLAYSGDVQTAAAVLAANPALADDPDALVNAAGEGHEPFVRLLLRYQPDLPKRIAFPAWSVGARTRELNELLFEHGMNPSQPDWLHVTPLHQFARTGNVDAPRSSSITEPTCTRATRTSARRHSAGPPSTASCPWSSCSCSAAPSRTSPTIPRGRRRSPGPFAADTARSRRCWRNTPLAEPSGGPRSRTPISRRPHPGCRRRASRATWRRT